MAPPSRRVARRRTRPLRAGDVMDRHVTDVGGRRLRVAVRPGTDPDRPPLLLCNGIGTEPDQARAVRRRARPRDRGGPLRPAGRGRLAGAAAALPVPAARPAGRPDAHDAGVPPVRRARRLLGRRPGPAARGAEPAALPSARAGGDGHGLDDGARRAAGAAADGHRPAAPGHRLRPRGRGRGLRRPAARAPRARRGAGEPDLRRAGTPTSSPRASAGPACRSWRCSGSPRWSSRATTTRSSRWSTPA